jgi:hypothetical protein
VAAKTYAFVKAGGPGVLSTQAYRAEVSFRLMDERSHQRHANTLVTPCLPHVNAPDTPHIRTAGKRITIKAAYRDQQTFIQAAQQRFSGTIEAIRGTRPIFHQGFEEIVALFLSFGP